MRYEPSRCGDHYIGSHLQAAFLLVPLSSITASGYDKSGNGQKIGKSLELHIDLLGQLPGRGDNDSPYQIFFRGSAGKQIEQRQYISCGFSGSGLGAGNQVLSVENDGNRCFLHGSRFLEIHSVESL